MQIGRGCEKSLGEELATKTNKVVRGTWQARWAMLIAGALASTGTACNLTPKTEDPPDSTEPTETTPAETCRYPDCPVATDCTTDVTVRRDTLEDCYGWDGSSWATTAPDIIKSCDGGTAIPNATCTCVDDSDDGFDNSICTFHFTLADVHPDPECTLGDEHDHPTSESACTYDRADTADADNFAKDVENDCLLSSPLEVPEPQCTDLDLGDVELGSIECTCDSSAAARIGRPPGASTTLSLDPAHSFLAVTTPVQSVMVRLSGDAFLDLPGNRLVGLKVSADRVRFGSSDWNGFSFSLDKPVPLARVGEAFRIPVAQKPTIIASGQRDGTLTRLRASAATDVTGHLSVAQKTWDLDFADKSVAGSFALHLVGRVAQ